MNFRSFEPNNPRGANSTLASDFLRSLPCQPDPSLVVTEAFCLPESTAFSRKRLPPRYIVSIRPILPSRKKKPAARKIVD
jgi:hypothetical protein